MNGEDLNKKEEQLSNNEPQAAEEKKKSAHSRSQYQRIAEIEKKLQQITAERDELKDRYLRSLADIDNTRKRLLKEKEQFQKFALSDFLLEILPVFDNLERALNVSSNNESAIVSGIRIILKQFSDILRKSNVIEIEAEGKVFNPELHQAIAREERDGIEQPIIVEVYQKGFFYNDRLLRPAIVKVAVPVERDTQVEEKSE